MKLRIAHIDDKRRLGGNFAVQRQVWGVWHDMFFNTRTSKLQSGVFLGEAVITDLRPAHFGALHEAMQHARAYKQYGKRIIRETWRV